MTVDTSPRCCRARLGASYSSVWALASRKEAKAHYTTHKQLQIHRDVNSWLNASRKVAILKDSNVAPNMISSLNHSHKICGAYKEYIIYGTRGEQKKARSRQYARHVPAMRPDKAVHYNNICRATSGFNNLFLYVARSRRHTSAAARPRHAISHRKAWRSPHAPQTHSKHAIRWLETWVLRAHHKSPRGKNSYFS